MRDISTKMTGDSLTADEFNDIPSELENAITDTGIALTAADLSQLSKSISNYVAGGSFYTDSGSGTAYVLSPVGLKKTPTAYFNGMSVSFVAGNSNTSNIPTIEVAGLSIKNIAVSNGVPLELGDIAGSGVTTLVFDSVNNTFTYPEVFASRAKEYGTVASMVADLGLEIGQKAEIKGYTTVGDGVNESYLIVAGSTGTDDGGLYHDLDNGLQAELIIGDVLLLSAFGAVDDATDQQAKYENAINAHISTGVKLIVDVRILLESVTTISTFDSIDIEFRKRVKYSSDANVLELIGEVDVTTAITAIATEIYPAGATYLVTKLTMSDATGIDTSDVVFVSSDDTYQFDTGVERGEMMAVLDTVGNDVYLHGLLSDTYTTTPTLSKIVKKDIKLKVLAEGDGDPQEDSSTAVPNVARACVTEVLSAYSKVDLDVRNGWGAGLTRTSCFLCDANITVDFLRNDTSNGSFGYGIEDVSMTRFCTSRVKARSARHAYTTNTSLSTVTGLDHDKGVPRANTITGEHINSTSASWDTHPGADGTVFIDIISRSTHLQALTPATGTQRGFQDRATNTTIKNFDYQGNGQVFFLGSKGSDYGFDYETYIEDVRAVKDPGYVASSTCFDLSGTGNTDNQTVVVNGGSITGIETIVSPPSAMTNIEVILGGGLRESGGGRLRVFSDQRLTISGFTRRQASGTMERIIADGDAEVSLLDLKLDFAGAGTASNVIIAQNAGTALIDIGNVTTNKRSHSFEFVADDGVNTPAVFSGEDKFTATATELGDATDRVNTFDKFTGKKQFDVTNSQIVSALGSGTTSQWQYSDGTTLPITPA